MVNNVRLIGRIYKTEFRTTHSGTSVLNARIGVKERDQPLTMVDLVFWSAIAERAVELLDEKNRTRISIEGALRQDKWVSEDGQPRTKLSVKVSQFFVLQELPVEDSE